MYKSLGELLQTQVLKISKRRKLKLQLFQNWAILAGTKAIKNDEAYTSPNRSITFLKEVCKVKCGSFINLPTIMPRRNPDLKIPFLQVKLT